ncbi:hypothetical protein K523DRAFT_361726 [Schizophyllum commune Tattone D]|nr:hypothetical protein K523DRAFT_361726 [Schizophyllum commune Tattone D]
MHRHRQPGFNTDASASMAFKCRQCSRWLASAVNVFAGEPNATPSGQPNDILNFFAVPSHRWLARAENISRGSPMTQNPSTSMIPSTASTSLLDVSQGHQCIAGSPNTTATGKPMAPKEQLNEPFGITWKPSDATQVHQYNALSGSPNASETGRTSAQALISRPAVTDPTGVNGDATQDHQYDAKQERQC